jgi:RsiW-degrading membrane proteinase PrsW (M82 family)
MASVAALSLGLGFALTYQALNSLKGRPSAVFSPRSPWSLVLLVAPCLILGQAMISFLDLPVFTSLAFPPFHILVAIAPALAILVIVGRRTRASSWRMVTLELSHGAVLAPLGALATELFVLFILTLGISFVIALTPGGIDRLMELSLNLQDPTWLEDPTNLARLVLSPAVLTVVVVIFVIIAPLAEEFLKGLGVLFLGYRLRGKAEALLWGVACGAGFALAESLFNGSIALEVWGAVMVMRWGATLMHCVASGIMALGWHAAIASKRPWRFLGAYGASAGIHALWNAAAIGAGIPSLLALTRPSDVATQGIAGLIALGFLGFLLLLTIFMALLMFYLTRRAVRPPPQLVALDDQEPT